MKYDYYKENYLKKKSNNRILDVKEFMERDKGSIDNQAAYKYFKRLPKHIKSNFKSFEDYLDMVREIGNDPSSETGYRQDKSNRAFKNKGSSECILSYWFWGWRCCLGRDIMIIMMIRRKTKLERVL